MHNVKHIVFCAAHKFVYSRCIYFCLKYLLLPLRDLHELLFHLVHLALVLVQRLDLALQLILQGG